MNKNKEKTFFDRREDWKNHWKNMPEFVQEKLEPHSKIIVRFRTKEDRDEFTKVINQKITKKTKSIWFPKLIRGIYKNKRFVSK